MSKLISSLLLTVILVFTCLLVPAAPAFQKEDDKAWTQWSKKDAEKMLTDSPWSQAQTETDTSEMFFSPTTDPNRMGTTANDSRRTTQGATNLSVNVKYLVRFFSARPVRRALVRLMELEQNPAPEMVQKLHAFADVMAADSIIVTVTVQSGDQRYERAVMQSINSAITAT